MVQGDPAGRRFRELTARAVATTPERPLTTHMPHGDGALGVSAYERVASWLICLLIFFGVAVATMFLLWFTSKVFVRPVAVPVVLQEQFGDEGGEGGGLGGIGGGPGMGLGLGQNLEGDGQQFAEETGLTEPPTEDTLTTLADAVAANTVMLDDLTLRRPIRPGGVGPRGDGHPPGGSGSGPGRPGRRRHWEVHFLEDNTLEGYARQLDYFGIELGVLMPDNKITYAYHLSKPKPDVRIGAADREQRYYLTWRSGGLQQADLDLLARAGVATEGRLVLKFLPPPLEADLAQKERARAASFADRILATYFGVRAEGAGYSFFVLDQTYR